MSSRSQTRQQRWRTLALSTQSLIAWSAYIALSLLYGAAWDLMLLRQLLIHVSMHNSLRTKRQKMSFFSSSTQSMLLLLHHSSFVGWYATTHYVISFIINYFTLTAVPPDRRLWIWTVFFYWMHAICMMRSVIRDYRAAWLRVVAFDQLIRFGFSFSHSGCISHDQTEKNHNLHWCQGNNNGKRAKANDWRYIESSAAWSMFIQQRQRSDVRRQAVTRLWDCDVISQSSITAPIRSSSEVIFVCTAANMVHASHRYDIYLI